MAESRNRRSSSSDSASEGRIGSKDVLEHDIDVFMPLHPIATDATGIDRIVGPAVDNWRPAQVEPDPVQVERQAAKAARYREAQLTRRGLLTDTDRVDDTAQPLVEANKAQEKAEDKAASSSSRSSHPASSASKES